MNELEKKAEKWLERYKFRVFDEGKCNNPNLYAWTALAIKESYIAGATEETKEAREILKDIFPFAKREVVSSAKPNAKEIKRAEQFLGER